MSQQRRDQSCCDWPRLWGMVVPFGEVWRMQEQAMTPLSCPCSPATFVQAANRPAPSVEGARLTADRPLETKKFASPSTRGWDLPDSLTRRTRGSWKLPMFEIISTALQSNSISSCSTASGSVYLCDRVPMHLLFVSVPETARRKSPAGSSRVTRWRLQEWLCQTGRPPA